MSLFIQRPWSTPNSLTVWFMVANLRSQGISWTSPAGGDWGQLHDPSTMSAGPDPNKNSGLKAPVNFPG